MISTLILKIKMLKISTFNIQNDYKFYNKNKSLEIIAFLKKNNIDILGLQEVNKKINRDLEEELEKINYTMQGEYRFRIRYLLNKINEKVPVITNRKVIDTHTYQLPFLPNPLRRIVTKVIISYKDKIISIYNTHLDFLFESVKKRELKKLYDLIKKDSNLIILMGDFNLKNNKEIFNKFEELLRKRNIYRVELKEKTLKSSKYKREIDHIFLSKEIRLLEKEVIKDIGVSDHYPVLISVEI